MQRHNTNDVFLNQTVFKTVVAVGKKFTTLIDVPYVHNSSTTPEKLKQSGIGDISFRLLGYRFLEKKRSAFTASVEVSLNTAQSPLLGAGKNLLLSVVSYTNMIPDKKILLSIVLHQANSLSGDEARANISFSKLQLIGIKYFGRKTWLVVAPELFLDYVKGGTSMNFRSRLAHAPTSRVNIWITAGAGLFGDFAGRYDWNVDAGGRYFLFRSKSKK